MPRCVTPVLNLLCEAESAQAEGHRRLCELLGPDCASTATRILAAGELRLGSLDPALLEMTAQTIEEHNFKRAITDWPFEHFWGNPYEPRHSKLLRYFIDPDSAHGCGLFLLEKLLEILGGALPGARLLPGAHCRVSQPDYIDLLIERDCADAKYAVIIENKINWAVDQWKQLQRYVASVMRRKFNPEQIYVFYLPLTADKDPDPADLNALRNELHVNFAKITFEAHILNWLGSALDEGHQSEWPSGMQAGMLENLSHYRNLVRYLVNSQKRLKMNREMLKQLEQAEKKSPLPTWSQVDRLEKSAAELKRCIESVLRGKLLLRIQTILKDRNVEALFHLDDGSGTPERRPITSPFDERFEQGLFLGIRVNGFALACFGISPPDDPDNPFFTGFMGIGDKEDQEAYKDIVKKAAESSLKDITGSNPPWYAWRWNKEVNHEKCAEEAIVGELADMMVEMRDNLANQLEAATTMSR